MFTSSATTSNFGPWWIGATDFGKEGDFEWCSLGEGIPLNTTEDVAFDIGQPDNNLGDEHCLSMSLHKDDSKPLELNDEQCSKKMLYICKVKKTYRVNYQNDV